MYIESHTSYSKYAETCHRSPPLMKKDMAVKGRVVARIFEDIQKNLPIMEKINMKYLGTLEHPLAKMLMEDMM